MYLFKSFENRIYKWQNEKRVLKKTIFHMLKKNYLVLLSLTLILAYA